MTRLSRFLGIVLAVMLLANQSLTLAIEPVHGTKTQAVLSDQFGAPVPDKGRPGRAGSHCGHGCHSFHHFIGHIAQSAGGGLVITAEMAALTPSTRIQTASLEAPYRPPRISPAHVSSST